MRILLAVDGSEPPDVAARMLSARPWPKGSVIRVLSIVENVYSAMPEAALSPAVRQLTLEFMQDAEYLGARRGDSLRASELTVGTADRQGGARAGIAIEAASCGAEVIVGG